MQKIKLIILFGSQATGNAGRKSDFDIAVLGESVLNLEEKSEIAGQMSEKLSVSEDEIDIVDLNSASPLLWQEVAVNGKLLDGNEFDFLKFKLLSWKTFLDTERFRKIRKESLSQNINV